MASHGARLGDCGLDRGLRAVAGGNLESWRRISIGLWYVGVYIGAWYLLQDAFANRGLRREWLIDAILIAGVPVMFVGYAQVELALTSGLPLPRPVGTLGNANALGALLALLLPLIAGRLTVSRSPLTRNAAGILWRGWRFGLLGLSFSRGGWIGGVVALALWAALSLPLLTWWRRLQRPLQAVVILRGGGRWTGGRLRDHPVVGNWRAQHRGADVDLRDGAAPVRRKAADRDRAVHLWRGLVDS